MRIVHRIDQGFALFLDGFGVNIPRNLFHHSTVEILCHNLAVEVLNVKIQLIVQKLAVGDLSCDGVIENNGVAGFVVDALCTQAGFQIMRGIVIDQIALDDSLAVGVFEDRLAEDLRGLERGRRRQRNTDRVKVFNDAAVFALVVELVTIKKLILAHLFVEDIAAVRLVDDDQVIVCDSGHGILIVIQDAFDHALDRGNLDAGLLVDALIVQLFDVVDIVQGQQFFQLDLFENVLSLLAQGVSVYQEEDAAEASRLQEAVDHAEDGSGFSCACRHGKENILLAVHNGSFRRLNGFQLVFAEVQAVFIAQKVIRHCLQALIARGGVLFQELSDTCRADPAVQGLRRVIRETQVKEPDTRFCFILLQIGAAIRGKGKGNLVIIPVADLILCILAADVAGIVLALVVNDRGNVLMDRLCLNRRHHLCVNEQCIIGIAAVTYGGIRRPLGNRHAAPLLRAYAFGMAQVFSISFPANFTQLLVDHVTGLCLGLETLAGGLLCLLFASVGIDLRRSGGGLFGLLNQLVFLTLFGGGVNRLGLRLRHDKGLALIVPVAVCLHEPLAQAVGHLQESLALFHGGIVLMRGLVSRLAQRMENVSEVSGDEAFPKEGVDPRNRGVVIRKRNAVIVEDKVDNGFPNHPQLHQAGV